MQHYDEQKLGGLSLMAGVLVILITIAFEFKIGWVSSSGFPDDIPAFISENWSGLEQIWYWQMIGQVLCGVAYLLLLKSARSWKTVLWALLFVGSIMTVIAFGLTLGSYGPALEVREGMPDIFASFRGGIRSLYSNIKFGPLIILLIFCLETFGKDGVVHKNTGIILLAIVAISIGLAAVLPISPMIMGLSAFLLPLMLGYGYWKKAPTA